MIYFLLLFLFALAGPVLAASPYCKPDGTLIEADEHVLKMFTLHDAHPGASPQELRPLADQYTVTYTIPACYPDGTRLPRRELNAQLHPK
jgi:hypothetical protein